MNLAPHVVVGSTSAHYPSSKGMKCLVVVDMAGCVGFDVGVAVAVAVAVAAEIATAFLIEIATAPVSILHHKFNLQQQQHQLMPPKAPLL